MGREEQPGLRLGSIEVSSTLLEHIIERIPSVHIVAVSDGHPQHALSLRPRGMSPRDRRSRSSRRQVEKPPLEGGRRPLKA
jgi:hypothetical protein